MLWLFKGQFDDFSTREEHIFTEPRVNIVLSLVVTCISTSWLKQTPEIIVLSKDLATNWYIHIKLSVIKRRHRFEALTKQKDKRDISLDDLLLANVEISLTDHV